MAQEKLPSEVQTFIVQQLAMFETPSAVVALVNQEFGLTISRQSVEKYDPTKVAGKQVAEKWRTLFHETRKTFLADTADIAVSHRAVRMRTLQRMVENAERMKNYALAASLLEQAAKEMGDAYSNRQKVEHSGKDGGPIQITRIELVPLAHGDSAD